jgi:hypothetical protein
VSFLAAEQHCFICRLACAAAVLGTEMGMWHIGFAMLMVAGAHRLSVQGGFMQ